MHERYCIVIQKEIIIESFSVTDMTAVTGAVSFRSERKGSGSTPMNAHKVSHKKLVCQHVFRNLFRSLETCQSDFKELVS